VISISDWTSDCEFRRFFSGENAAAIVKKAYTTSRAVIDATIRTQPRPK
jgi:hypothetical protein